MPKINLLDIHIANLIAAGEVVERPSSALKELIENSIDAGASVITAEIKNGGAGYMRVTDNGEGMTAEDLGRCILRHSTSKISDEKDLSRIKTLGFRGEALAAVSSVSEMKIFTKQRGARTGYVLEVANGQNTKISEAGCADGTTVIVERLFAKIPARQKFLKRDLTESMYCKSVVEKIALSNPLVSFRLIQDGRETLFTPGGGSLKNTIYAVYKDDVADRLIPVTEDAGNNGRAVAGKIKVSGYICRIEDCRSRRTDENFFVNGRYVRSKSILSAVEEAYDAVAETGKFPVCALYITIDESLTDVNVHPQKLEVKFSDERKIFESVYYAVKNTLQSAGYAEAALENEDEKDDEGENKSENKDKDEYKHEDENGDIDGSFINTGSDAQNAERNNGNDPYRVEVTKYNFDDENAGASGKNAEDTAIDIDMNMDIEYGDENRRNDFQDIEIYSGGKNYKFIGEAFYGYLLIEKDEKLIVIDKHAAHERILFDAITKKSYEVKANMQLQYESQILLEPAEIRLNPEEAALIFEFREDIQKAGIVFDLKDDGKDGIISVTEVPAAITGTDIEEIIREMAHMLAEENYTAHEAAFEKLAAVTAKKTVACKAAMKNGIRDEPEHLQWLAEQILAREGAKNCPHGRPVVFEISKKYLERQFGR